MTDIDIEKAAAFVRRKQLARQKELDARFIQATCDFERITEMIVERYRPRRIYQWGSLLDRRRFSEISDIDIAVEGIGSVEAYFQLLGDADEMTDFPVDLVEMEKIDPLHADSIRRKGRLVYEEK